VDLHFEFVQQLAGSLGSGEIDLPAFPDVVGRLQATLVDEDASVREVLGIISSEPVLTARLLKMANSAPRHRGGLCDKDDPRMTGALTSFRIKGRNSRDENRAIVTELLEKHRIFTQQVIVCG
jgi:hypothetical protein